jgi:hypothetical protein
MTPSGSLRGLTEGIYGPSFFQGAPLRSLLQNPFYVTNFALTKLAAPLVGAAPVSSALQTYLATSGEELFWLPRQDTSWSPLAEDIFSAYAPHLEETGLRFPPQVKKTHPALWPSLWAFVSPNQQPRVSSFRAHTSTSPAYFLSKALVLLSVRNELSQRTEIAAYPHPLETAGARNPLFAELASLFASHQPLNSTPRQLALAPRFSRSLWLEGFWGEWAKLVSRPLATALNNQSLQQAKFRSAFVPLKTDIGSIRRLRVTKGICLPSDTAIHLIAGSKDVIHS